MFMSLLKNFALVVQYSLLIFFIILLFMFSLVCLMECPSLILIIYFMFFCPKCSLEFKYNDPKTNHTENQSIYQMLPLIKKEIPPEDKTEEEKFKEDNKPKEENLKLDKKNNNLFKTIFLTFIRVILYILLTFLVLLKIDDLNYNDIHLTRFLDIMLLLVLILLLALYY